MSFCCCTVFCSGVSERGASKLSLSWLVLGLSWIVLTCLGPALILSSVCLGLSGAGLERCGESLVFSLLSFFERPQRHGSSAAKTKLRRAYREKAFETHPDKKLPNVQPQLLCTMHVQQTMTDRSELLVRKLQFHLPPGASKGSRDLGGKQHLSLKVPSDLPKPD